MNTLQKLISYLSKIRQMPRAWRYTVTALACVVIFVTTYALVLPAITVDQATAEADPAIVLEEKAEKETEAAEEIIAETTAPEDAVLVVETAETEAPETEIYEEAETEIAATEETEAEEVFTEEVQSEDNTEIESESEISETESETITDETEASETEMAAETEEDPSYKAAAGKLTYAGDDYKITVSYDVSANLPADAELLVEEIYDGGSAEMQAKYDAYYEKSLEAVRKKGGDGIDISFARYFDISIMYEGEKLEPASDVDVKITYNKKSAPEVAEQGDVKVVHFEDGKADAKTLTEQKNDVSVSTSNEKLNEVTFKTDGFSVYGIVGTTIEKIVITSDGHNYLITVTYGAETGIPEDADLRVEELTVNSAAYDDYVSKSENVLGRAEGSSGYIRLFDISIVNKDDHSIKYQPAQGTTVDVKIELADAEDEKDLNVVHFSDADAEGELIETETDGQVVSFEAEGFSVYAVVGDGEITEESRATVNFYGKNTSSPIETVYVKNSDTAEEIEEIVPDPGCGQLANKELFDGWVISTVNTTDGSEYTINTQGVTIEAVREYLEQLEIKEGDIVNVYAKIVKTITISYLGETQNIILGSDIVKVLGDESAEYEISMNYTPETAEQAFMGWNVAEGASNIKSATYGGQAAEAPYSNGTKITVNGDVTLSVNAPHGYWLVFDENGKGATYNAPQFIEDGNVTRVPSGAMTRLGYSFGGWYTDKACTDGNEFIFGGALTDNTTIYAKWTPAQTANFTVIVWKERMSDTYAENGGTGEGKEKNYDFAESYTLTGNVGTNANAISNGSSSVVDGDAAGTRYYNARIRGTSSNGGNVDQTVAYTGYHCAKYDTDVEITPEGNTVINVYYDRNTVTYTFYTYGQSSSDGAWYLCKEDGSQIIRDGQRADRNTGITTSTAANAQPYTGIVSRNDGRTYYYSTTGACGGTNMREAHWEFVSSSGSQWNVYQEEIGLYGESLNWPTDTSIWWYENHGSTSGTGTRMTYKDAFLPLNDDMTVEYWGNTASASGTIHFWTQDVEGGNAYTDKVQVATGNANFSINDKFTGFYAYQYRTDNGTWRNVGNLNPSTGIYGDPVSYNNRLDIRYNRIKAAITFLDGAYFSGNGNRLDEEPQATAFYTSPEYYYEASVASYNKNGADYYTPPEKAGYTFAGWYADDACTLEYDFTTMPASGITVYAKWIQNEYRVFLHPNVPEADTTLDWGSEDQEMNFRVPAGSNVSTPTGRRTDYKLVGWYLDEACTQVFDAEHYILNDTSVTTPYDQSVDMTDVMNKYGNIVGTGTNSDALNGRFWINRKLDLYAKWRAELIGADGIGVKYDANGGTNPPSDTNLYLDNSDTVAQGAPTPPDETQQFLYWVLQTWDEETGEYVDIEGEDNKIYPGQTFTVLKSNAYIEELEGSTPDDPKYRYTVQLRAEYGPKDEPTPTHIWWFPNNVDADRHSAVKADDDLQVNETVTIPDAPTRAGYEFIGWARITEDASESSPGEGSSMPTAKVLNNLTEDDLFLTYHKAEGSSGAYYTAVIDGSPERVTKVAADERNPYQDLYAVWEKKTYTVTITKVVDSEVADDSNIPFTFTPVFAGSTGDEFRLVGNENGADITEGDGTVHINHTKEFTEVPYDTEFSITEAENPDFEVSVFYDVTNADAGSENKTDVSIENGDTITVKGDVDITVTNVKKVLRLRVKKTDIDGTTALGGAVFTTTVEGVTFTLTSDSSDGYLKNDIFTDGTLTVPYGTYTLKETTPPAGYLPLTSDITIRLDSEGVHSGAYNVDEPTDTADYYTLYIPNNPGVTLPATGGSGTRWIYLLGACLVMISGLLLITRKRLK